MSKKDLTSEMLGELKDEPAALPAGNIAGLPSTFETATGRPIDDKPTSNPKPEDSGEHRVMLPTVDLSVALPPSTDPLRGLDVMAIVAGEAKPQVMPSDEVISDQVQADVEIVAPSSKAINDTMSLAHLYAFEGTKELGNKINKVQKRSLIRSYLRAHETGFVEQPLASFYNWFQHLRFANGILHPDDVQNKMWHFRHVLLSPKIDRTVSFETAPKKYAACVESFYKDVFHSSPSMVQQIERALAVDISIMMFALLNTKKVQFPSRSRRIQIL